MSAADQLLLLLLAHSRRSCSDASAEPADPSSGSTHAFS